MEDLKEIHEEAIKPLSIEEQANSIDLSGSRKDIADRNDRKVLVKVLEINGIDHDTLNISKSKFAKMNKLQLVNALFDVQKQSEKAETKEQGEGGADYLQKVLELKEIVSEAQRTKDYKKLDSAIATNLIEAISQDDKLSDINFKSPHFTKAILIIGSIYFIARLYGFEKISNKISEIINKTKGKNGTHEDN